MKLLTESERIADRIEDRVKTIDDLAADLHQMAGHPHLFRFCQELPCYELRRELFAILEDLEDSGNGTY